MERVRAHAVRVRTDPRIAEPTDRSDPVSACRELEHGLDKQLVSGADSSMSAGGQLTRRRRGSAETERGGTGQVRL